MASSSNPTLNPAWPQKQSHSLRPSTAPVRRGSRRGRDVNIAEPVSSGTSVVDENEESQGNRKPKVWKKMRSAAPDHSHWKDSVAKVPGSEYYNKIAYEQASVVDQELTMLYQGYRRRDNPLTRSMGGSLGGGQGTLRGLPLPGGVNSGFTGDSNAGAALLMDDTRGLMRRPQSAVQDQVGNRVQSRLEQTHDGEYRPPRPMSADVRTYDGNERTLGRSVRGNFTREAYGDHAGTRGTAEMRQQAEGGGQLALTSTLEEGADAVEAMQLYGKRKAEQYLGTTGTDLSPTGEKVKLPLGWTKHREKDGDRSRTYYYNRFSGESRWERPEGIEIPDMMKTETATRLKEEINEHQQQEQQRQLAAIEQNVVEGDGLHDVDENLPDVVLFFIVIYRYLRANYRRFKKQLKKAFEKQVDEEVMAILMRENEAFALTHMGVGVDMVEYVEPLEARKIPAAAAVHLTLEETENDTLMLRLPRLGDGWEHFRKWILTVAKCCYEGGDGGDAWVRTLWERLNYQVEEEERERNPSKTYSLEQLQRDHGLEHYKVMERELRQRVMDLSKSKTETYEKLAIKQRTGATQDVARLKDCHVRLRNTQKELAQLRKQKEEQARVLRKVDGTYDTSGLVAGSAVVPSPGNSGTPAGAAKPAAGKKPPPLASPAGGGSAGTKTPTAKSSGRSPKKKPG
mmetsp:Transcript_11980/g.29010  ORF Transcript_11980/g.29010 Transcript_11980/m.29010 type:complete len:682 (-) Transcript_11980:607-2652(-)